LALSDVDFGEGLDSVDLGAQESRAAVDDEYIADDPTVTLACRPLLAA
jgi:hypothetical protein